MSNEHTVQRVKFGITEWIGIVALVLTPLLGVIGWSFALSNRMTASETTQVYLTKTMEEFVEASKLLIKVSQQMDDMERRIDRLETRRENRDDRSNNSP